MWFHIIVLSRLNVPILNSKEKDLFNLRNTKQNGQQQELNQKFCLPMMDSLKKQPPRPTQNKYPMKRWLGGYGIWTEACLVWCRHSLRASRITSEKCCFLFLRLWCGPNRRMPQEGIWWLWISHFYTDSFLLFCLNVGSWEVFCEPISRLCQVYWADWGIGNVASSIFLVRLFWYTHCLTPKKMVLL